MKTMNQSLYELYKSGRITYETALTYSSDPADLQRIMQKKLTLHQSGAGLMPPPNDLAQTSGPPGYYLSL